MNENDVDTSNQTCVTPRFLLSSLFTASRRSVEECFIVASAKGALMLDVATEAVPLVFALETV
jgi:hypothetical protein